ncbi:hypothetical protein K458DRAFT_383801 [Lentithecium fluviatile CBS 122367]|uniref:Uncharacterized protein n=1 Tax=Lentithecium fluviatile CBS 122367 TaxID=1168545 RepID=A0A6G1JF16_9PLEO|nr:hypothetical protein K458DRAFT_383801 [Lentithecium fluviatile CBS 122367]
MAGDKKGAKLPLGSKQHSIIAKMVSVNRFLNMKKHSYATDHMRQIVSRKDPTILFDLNQVHTDGVVATEDVVIREAYGANPEITKTLTVEYKGEVLLRDAISACDGRLAAFNLEQTYEKFKMKAETPEYFGIITMKINVKLGNVNHTITLTRILDMERRH